VPSFSDSIGEIGGVMRTMLGLTRHSRIRDQIKGNLELYETMLAHEQLLTASSELAQLITRQTNNLCKTSRQIGRQWAWGPCVLAWIVAGACGYGAVLLNHHWATLWGTPLIVVLWLATALFFAVGVTLLLERKTEDNGSLETCGELSSEVTHP
jgi:hypothetical protein